MSVVGRARLRLSRSAVVVRGAIASELAAVRTIDRLTRARGRATRYDLGQDLTAVIKTFERPRLLYRLVASIRRLSPSLPLVVVDDSRDPVEIDGVDLVTLPYDSGASVGKNAGLERVRTEYVLMLDDDFVFYRHTDLAPTLVLMAEHPEIDIVGGKVVNLPSVWSIDYSKAALPTDVAPVVAPGSRIAGLPVYDKVANFFVGRADRVRLVGWDPRVKRLGHADFFARARGVLTTVFNADLRCLHAQDRFDTEYMAKRNDTAADRIVLANRWLDKA